MLQPAIKTWLGVTAPGYRLSRGRILAIHAGLMAAISLAALDQTIVATALPELATDLHGLSDYSWVFTAYMLGSTVTIPVYGKLGDVYGRRPLLLVSVSLFLVGSLLCGLAQTMWQLALFRAVQGLGAGGILPLSLAVIGSVIPPRDRGRYQGLISGIFTAGSLAGPAVGGFIVDNTSWRWIFYVNLPICALSIFLISSTLTTRAVRRDHSVDWGGALLVAVGTGSILLGLGWSREFSWSSPRVTGALAAGVALLLMFAVVERRAREPILPFALLRNSTVSTSLLAMGLGGMAMFGTLTFVPLFVQGVIGTTATRSGVALTPLLVAAGLSTIVSGLWVVHTGRYKASAVLGVIVLGIGMALLWRLSIASSTWDVAWAMAIAGIGIGLMMQVFLQAVQSSVPLRNIGSATALAHFSRAIGGTLGVAAMGVIVNVGLPARLRSYEDSLQQLPIGPRTDLARALELAFVAPTCLCVIVLAVVIFGLKEAPLSKSLEEPAAHPISTPTG